MRSQRTCEVVQSNLIRVCGDDGVSSTLHNDKIIERMHTHHIRKHDFVVLALAEVFDNVVSPDCHRTCVLEHELIFAALSAVTQLAVTPHIISDGAAKCCGPSDQSIVATFGGAGQRLSVAEELVAHLSMRLSAGVA